MNKPDTIYDTVSVYWEEANTSSKYTGYNITIARALLIAKKFGYKEPKWYEFWRRKAEVRYY